MNRQDEPLNALNDLKHAEAELEESREKDKAMRDRCDQVSQQVTDMEHLLAAAVTVRQELIQTLLFDSTGHHALDRHNDEHIRRERELTDLIDLRALAMSARDEAARQVTHLAIRVARLTEQHKKVVLKTRADEIKAACGESMEELALCALDTGGGWQHPVTSAKESIIDALFPDAAFRFDERRRMDVTLRMRGEGASPKVNEN